jgi:protein-disulfide isomerase
MRARATIIALATLALLPAGPGFAQQAGSDVKKELEALKEGQVRLQKELQEIKTLLQARPAVAPGPPAAGQPLNAVLTVDGAPFKGNKNAKITLIDFTDYQ